MVEAPPAQWPKSENIENADHVAEIKNVLKTSEQIKEYEEAEADIENIILQDIV